MNKWEKIKCNSNLIQAKTDKALLIKLPKQKFKFWHPIKLCRLSGKSDFELTISFTSDFVFKLFRNGEGKTTWNKVIEEKELTAEQLINQFIGED